MKRLKFKGLAASLLAAFVLTALVPTTAFAADNVAKDSVDNIMAAGEEVLVDGASLGDVFGSFVAGYNFSYDEVKAEDAVAIAGYSINVSDSEVGSSMFVAGYDINVDKTTVNGNIMAAGNSINIDDSTVGKAIYVAGNDITFDGEATTINLSGTNVTVAGTVHGDAKISADNVTIGENAVIDGKLYIEAASMPTFLGDMSNYEFEYVQNDNNSVENVAEAAVKTSFLLVLWHKVKKSLYWAVAMIIVAVLMRTFVNKPIDDSLKVFKDKKGLVFALGAAALVGVPVACLLVCFTFVGIPLSVLVLAAYIFFLALGTAFTGSSLSQLVFPKLNPYVSTIICVAILEVAIVIPFLGFLVKIACDLYILGYIVISLFDKKNGTAAV